ncbi:Thioredoxin family protein [Sulfidibacter corallicola]|uniref:Thioredoxin family protein n=1 Tax=Sulfidibacter corallicola TaxID=2818388 RepID=A0A8A4TVA0_SULCO|nr:thioredoxin family protein [Sulfidibacter corallicola]QTD50455.1 thioredoxin family protein [Sulfidibacter corallicola]
MTTRNPIVSHEAWITARKELLAKEKEFVRLRDQLTRQVRELPWEPVDKDYRFEGPNGPVTLNDLFGSKNQLIVYHFMFGPDWEEGCKSCSFLMDHVAPSAVHMADRGVALALVSRAPMAKLTAFQRRMGWQVNWVSSFGTDFNGDYQVTATEAKVASGDYQYNYRPNTSEANTELPGLSVFAKDEDGRIYHTYSTYARGLDSFIGAYRLLDVVPQGRNEAGLSYPMEWIRHRDKYANAPDANAKVCH